MLLALVEPRHCHSQGSKWQHTVWGLDCSLLTLGRRTGSRDFHSLLAPTLFSIPKISTPGCTSSGSCLYQRLAIISERNDNEGKKQFNYLLIWTSRAGGVPRQLCSIGLAPLPPSRCLGDECGPCCLRCLNLPLSLISTVALG